MLWWWPVIAGTFASWLKRAIPVIAYRALPKLSGMIGLTVACNYSADISVLCYMGRRSGHLRREIAYSNCFACFICRNPNGSGWAERTGVSCPQVILSTWGLWIQTGPPGKSRKGCGQLCYPVGQGQITHGHNIFRFPCDTWIASHFLSPSVAE